MVSKDTCEVSGVGSMVRMFNKAQSRFIDSSLEIVGLSRNYMQNSRSWPEAITNFRQRIHLSGRSNVKQYNKKYQQMAEKEIQD